MMFGGKATNLPQPSLLNDVLTVVAEPDKAVPFVVRRLWHPRDEAARVFGTDYLGMPEHPITLKLRTTRIVYMIFLIGK